MTEFQAAVLGRVDMAVAFAVASVSIMVCLLAVIAVRALWSR